MKKHQSTLIVFEGRDGTGKATQSALLASRLRDHGIGCALIDFPQYETPTGKRITQYLQKKTNHSSPYEVAQLYADDRHAARKRLTGLLRTHRVVIADRYVPANLAYCTALEHDVTIQDALFEKISELEYGKNRMPHEDMVIYFRVDDGSAPQLAYKQGTENDRYLNEPDYLKRVERQYELFAKRFGWLVITCTHNGTMRPKEDIAEEVWKHVQKFTNV